MPSKADNCNKVSAVYLCTSSNLSVKEAMKKAGFSNFEIENENKQRVMRKRRDKLKKETQPTQPTQPTFTPISTTPVPAPNSTVATSNSSSVIKI